MLQTVPKAHTINKAGWIGIESICGTVRNVLTCYSATKRTGYCMVVMAGSGTGMTSVSSRVLSSFFLSSNQVPTYREMSQLNGFKCLATGRNRLITAWRQSVSPTPS